MKLKYLELSTTNIDKKIGLRDEGKVEYFPGSIIEKTEKSRLNFTQTGLIQNLLTISARKY